MALGIGTLAVPPAAFWAMTPRELQAVADGRAGIAAAPLARADLEALMTRYPDS